MSDPLSPSEEARLDAMVGKLDESTEARITALVSTVWSCSEGQTSWEAIATEEDALRSRIRTLIEEARENAIRITEEAWRPR